MKRLIIPLLTLMMVLSACSASVTADDLVHADIYYENSLILQQTEGLASYYTHLMMSPLVVDMPTADLVYDLKIRTVDDLYDYQLLFDLENEQAVAVSNEGTYKIPFGWLDDYIEAMPPIDAFSYLMPPDLNLEIDGYRMDVGYDRQWLIHPTEASSFEVNSFDPHSENYKTTDSALIIKATFDTMPPDSLTLTVIGTDSTDIYREVDLNALPTPDKVGAYRYEVAAVWKHPEKGYSGTVIYSFGLSFSKPTSYSLNKTSYQTGDCMALLIENPTGLDYRVETPTYGLTVGLFYLGDDLTGLIPLDPDTEPGSYELEVYRDSTDTLLHTIAYEVYHKDFGSQQLTVTGSTASLKSDDNRAKDAEKFKNAKAYSVGEKLWEGTFLQPVEGRISTEYALKRYTNGSSSYYRHSGIDIAAPLGTPIQADNHGIITFASDLIISGNTVVIDHGYGLFSTFIHLDEIYVEEGQEVKKGDIIAAVGTTGYSTGPHLHWSLWKNGVFLNPWKFIDEDPLEGFEQ